MKTKKYEPEIAHNTGYLSPYKIGNLIKISMTLRQFNELDEMEQAEAVWSGVHIGERQDDEHTISLYQIDGLYVEVFYHREYNVIRKIIALSSTEQLTPYLGQISIRELFYPPRKF